MTKCIIQNAGSFRTCPCHVSCLVASQNNRLSTYSNSMPAIELHNYETIETELEDVPSVIAVHQPTDNQECSSVV